jgi:chorismate dehydratase
MWDFEHEPGCSELSQRYSIHRTSPSECARELAQDSADVGLVPVAAYATTPSLAIVPGCAIASLDRVRSILLVVRERTGVEAVHTIAADTSSKTSLAYAQILFRKYWNSVAEFVPHPPDLESMLQSADAALLIGDPALLALEDRTARLERTGEALLYLDLAHEWKLLTGLPWVSAFWAVRPEVFARTGISSAEVVTDFVHSRDNGMAHIEDLVTEWSTKIAVPADTIRRYLSTNIHYILDEACLAGLDAFYRYAAELQVLPPAPKLHFL